MRFELDKQGVGEWMRGKEMRQMVRKSGDRIAARAGSGFEADTWISSEPGRSGQPRAVSGVQTESYKAMARQRKYNILQRSIDAGRVR